MASRSVGVRLVTERSTPDRAAWETRQTMEVSMRLPNTAQTSRPWRIHELTQDFRLEDVWALPTPGGADDFRRLVHLIASGDPSRRSPARCACSGRFGGSSVSCSGGTART